MNYLPFRQLDRIFFFSSSFGEGFMNLQSSFGMPIGEILSSQAHYAEKTTIASKAGTSLARCK
jgi:hypothetical protein